MVMNSLFKPGLVSMSFRELGLEEIINMVSRNGLEGIEWGGDVHVPHGDLAVAERAGRLTREAGLAVSAYGSYYCFDDCTEVAEGKGLEFASVLDSAEALGAPYDQSLGRQAKFGGVFECRTFASGRAGLRNWNRGVGTGHSNRFRISRSFFDGYERFCSAATG